MSPCCMPLQVCIIHNITLFFVSLDQTNIVYYLGQILDSRTIQKVGSRWSKWCGKFKADGTCKMDVIMRFREEKTRPDLELPQRP